jgi:pyruvate/2-oxoglutarate dehydrogenase complex dihydrolipoamide dehydrogenase (E3) component
VSEQREFDVIVVGGGAVGENAADRAGRTGLSVALVEHALVGGECSYYACMPSKALLRPGGALAAARAVPGAAGAVTGRVDAAAVFRWRDEVTHGWDDSSQVRWTDSAGITLVRGHARLAGPKVVDVARGERASGPARASVGQSAPADASDGGGPSDDEGTVRLVARHAVVLATGSSPVVPPVDGLADVDPWTSRDATSAHAVPPRLLVVGGGVVGVEMATAYAELGSEVTLVVRGPRVLAGAEPFAGDAVAAALQALGVRVLLDSQVAAVARTDRGIEAAVTGSGAGTVTADRVLVAAGRRPGTTDVGVETVGLEVGRPVAVDDAMCATGVDGGWLFAVGDVTGRTGTTHQGKYDARVAGDVIAARFGGSGAGGSGSAEADAERTAGPWSRYRATADHRSVPQVVFTHPEVAWVGLTEAAAQDAGLKVRAIDYDLADVSGAYVYDPGYAGRGRLVVDDERGVVVGATFVGPDVAELLHAATVAVVGEVPLDRLWHAVPAYPTISEVWLRFLETAGL